MNARTNLPKFSIIMPSKNQGDFIERSILSVLNQDYPEKELIVVDGGSTDNTTAILKKYKKDIILLSDKDRGQSEAINRGLRLVTGQILSYLNSDDTYAKHCLNQVADFFKKNRSAKVLHGNGNFIDTNDQTVGKYDSREATLKNLYKRCVVSQPTVFWKREVFDKIGFFDERLEFVMDYDYWMRIAQKYKIYFLDKLLANTRLHQSTKTARSREGVFKESLIIVKKNYGYLSDRWVFEYAYARFYPVDRSSWFKNLKFVLGVFFISLATYLRYFCLPGKKGLQYWAILVKSLMFYGSYDYDSPNKK